MSTVSFKTDDEQQRRCAFGHANKINPLQLRIKTEENYEQICNITDVVCSESVS